jgi:hypothetical protein
MADHQTAIERHSCPACGARAEWNPTRQALVCAYCGTVVPGELDAETGRIREIDLVKTLREMPDELRGWKSERRSVQCRSCHAISVFEAERVGQNCEFCGSPELVDYDEIKAPIRPQSLLPFKIDTTRVRERVKRWFASKWLAPSRFKNKAFVDTLRGLYIPYWTFDSQVHCPWTAESGTYYYTTQSYTGSDGKRRTRRVRHTRWRPAAGVVDHFFDDEPVPGTRGLPEDLLRRIEPFPTSDLVPYDTAYLSGFVIEHYQVVLVDAAQSARQAMERALERLCAARVPGDTYRNLSISPSYSGETFKHILVPVWLLGYGYRGRTYRLLVNGYTGKIAGTYPKSAWKIFFLVLLAALVIGAIVIVAR